MWTKSKIQLIKEALAVTNDYKEILENIMDKYTIEDSIFVYNGRVQEVTQGYFVEKSKFNTLYEALKECKGNYINNGIRIINNKEFVVGSIKNYLSECSEADKVFDINRLTDIR